MNEHERQATRFILREKRERWEGALANAKRRPKLLAGLGHTRDLVPRWKIAVPPGQQHARDIAQMLRSRGAGDMCHAVSEWSQLDGRNMVLEEALAECIGMGMGTLLSCVPGELAYYEGEGPSDRYLLVRPAPPLIRDV